MLAWIAEFIRYVMWPWRIYRQEVRGFIDWYRAGMPPGEDWHWDG